MEPRRSARDIRNVYGIGSKKRDELRNLYNIRTIDSLRTHAVKIPGLLNRVQTTGLAYHSRTSKKISLAEAMLHVKYMTRVFKGKKRGLPIVSVAGSVRREATRIGDIDFVVIGDMDYFVDTLLKKKYIVEILTQGQSKCSAVCLVGESYRIVDIVATTPADYPYAMLYLTGNSTENIIMRNRAKKMGYSLSQNGLVSLKTGRYVEGLKTEKAVYEFLGLDYKEPYERTSSMSKKSSKAD